MKNFLDWSSYENAGMGDAYADIPKRGGDYAKAIAVCIGSQQCEQMDKGVMCPSYRVTGSPALSTGGRVKLLKTALNAPDESALFTNELRQAMDLCVSCKGCKRECENEVDMATIKVEYLAHLAQAGKLPWRNKLWAHLPKLLEWPLIKSLIRLRNQHIGLAKLFSRWLGLAWQINLPEPAVSLGQTVTTAKYQSKVIGEVVLFADTFNRNFNSIVVEATSQLLSAAGYKVHLVGASDRSRSAPLCCGRSYLANGMIEKARAEATRLLQALKPYITAGHSIIGLEPSCILSLRDEYLKLGLGDSATELAGKVFLLEEFIAKEQVAKRWQLSFKGSGEQVLVYGHCHQKAVGAMKAMRKVLKTIDNIEFDFIESSCCGMAGSFGFETEHYELSQAMAEQALFPALRAKPGAAVVANGFSCQQQISHGGFGKPKHLAEILLSTVSLPQEVK